MDKYCCPNCGAFVASEETISYIGQNIQKIADYLKAENKYSKITRFLTIDDKSEESFSFIWVDKILKQ